MTWLDLTLAVVGLTGVLLALVSEPMQRRLPVTEPLVALGLGVLPVPPSWAWSPSRRTSGTSCCSRAAGCCWPPP